MYAWVSACESRSCTDVFHKASLRALTRKVQCECGTKPQEVVVALALLLLRMYFYCKNYYTYVCIFCLQLTGHAVGAHDTEHNTIYVLISIYHTSVITHEQYLACSKYFICIQILMHCLCTQKQITSFL